MPAFLKTALKITTAILLTLFVLSIAVVILYKYIPIPGTPLMYSRYIFEGKEINYEWVPLEKITPDLQLAVVAAEDNLFTTHNGFDMQQIQIAREQAKKGKKLRGASTISQQTAKNVFLWNGRSWLRKGLEAYYTVLIEQIWGKRRIMEVYLNCIEMGDGIYGAAAVAKHHFNRKPSKLTRQQCALIAASLPNPLKRNSKKPTKQLIAAQKRILRNMQNVWKVEYPN